MKCGAKPPSPVCDYFSAGAILYTLLTRKKPTSDIICDDRFDLFAFEKIADKSLRELIKKMCCIDGFEYRSFSELLADANPVFERYGYEAIEVFDTQFEELRVISTSRKRNKLIGMFNTSLLYEIAVLKKYAYPLLHGIGKDSPYYTRSRRLCKFLHYFKDLDEENEIPPTSILREFIGGCTFYGE